MSFLEALARPLRALNPLGTLPKPTGPYPVGSHDIEWVPEGYNLGEALMEATHPKTVLARLYYPGVLPKGGGYIKDKWLPEYDYAKGYMNFAGISLTIAPLIATPMSTLALPSYADIPIIPITSPFPTVLFSHGLAGCRTTYSHLCTHLASHGFLVLAVEHRDGTAPYTTSRRPYYDEEGKLMPSKLYPYEAWQKRQSGTESLREWRRGQLKYRVTELYWAWQLLQDTNAGNIPPPENFMERREGAHFTLRDLKGSIDFSRFVVAGHSFGAATILSALTRFPPDTIAAAIALDPWMLPHDAQDDAPLGVPLLVINSDSWRVWSENFVQVEKYVARAAARKDGAKVYNITIKRSGHQNASDFPLIMGTFGKFANLGAGNVDPMVALDVQAALVDGYLRVCLGRGDGGKWVREGLRQDQEDIFVKRVGLSGDDYVIWHNYSRGNPFFL